jgi:hypothetical protein
MPFAIHVYIPEYVTLCDTEVCNLARIPMALPSRRLWHDGDVFFMEVRSRWSYTFGTTRSDQMVRFRFAVMTERHSQDTCFSVVSRDRKSSESRGSISLILVLRWGVWAHDGTLIGIVA